MGIELELEGFRGRDQEEAQSFLGEAWHVTGDGSLRNGGVEFVTAGGKGGVDLHAAFVRINDLLARVQYDASFRCSTHMHLNMQDFTFNQVARFMLAYTCVEPVLFTFCGNYRRSSNFCVPIAESLPFHKKLIARLYDDAIGSHSGAACNKYTAMNFLPLFDGGRDRPPLGTVEFRGGRPLTTTGEFIKQANLLLALKKYVRDFNGTDDEFLASITTHGAVQVLYPNGEAQDIDCKATDLDDAAITAWLLLKSYQAGMEWRKSQGARQQAALEAAQRSRGTSNRAMYFDWNAGPARPESSDGTQPAINYHTPTGPWVWGASTKLRGHEWAGTWNAGYNYINISVLRDRGVNWVWTADNLPWSDIQWPNLHRHLSFLQNNSRNLTDPGLFIALRDTLRNAPVFADSRLGGQAIERIIASSMAALSVSYVSGCNSFLVDFCLAFQYGLWSGVETHAWPGCSQDLRCTTVNFVGGVDYRWAMKLQTNHRVYTQLRSLYPEIWTPTTGEEQSIGVDASRLWNAVMTTTVRLKNRERLVEERDRRIGSGPSELKMAMVSQRMSVVGARALFNLTMKSSFLHIRNEDLETYDRMCHICDLLTSIGCLIPIHRPLNRDTSQVSQNGAIVGESCVRNVNPSNYTLGYGAIGTERRTARTSDTTGQAIY